MKVEVDPGGEGHAGKDAVGVDVQICLPSQNIIPNFFRLSCVRGPGLGAGFRLTSLWRGLRGGPSKEEIMQGFQATILDT